MPALVVPAVATTMTGITTGFAIGAHHFSQSTRIQSPRPVRGDKSAPLSRVSIPAWWATRTRQDDFLSRCKETAAPWNARAPSAANA